MHLFDLVGDVDFVPVQGDLQVREQRARRPRRPDEADRAGGGLLRTETGISTVLASGHKVRAQEAWQDGCRYALREAQGLDLYAVRPRSCGAACGAGIHFIRKEEEV